MIFASLLAATLTFTATATGVEKGTTIEFVFAGKNSDRDYESMFLLDEPIDSFCRRLEEAGIPRGRPVDQSSCRLWPVGCALTFSPSVSTFVNGSLPDGYSPVPVYTGGTRCSDGTCEASDEMPAALFSTYTLAQAPIVFNCILEQGVVYGRLTAAQTLEKGRRFTFTMTGDPQTLPKHLDLTVQKGNGAEILKRLRDESAAGEIDACIGFDENLSVREATAVAQALATIDSTRVKINGARNVFYRAFLPLVKWLDRKERLQQPFELTLLPGGSQKLVFIDEDWSVEGDDPKLSLREIPLNEARRHTKTDTCFIFADSQEKVSRIVQAMSSLKDTQVKNWYVFERQ